MVIAETVMEIVETVMEREMARISAEEVDPDRVHLEEEVALEALISANKLNIDIDLIDIN